MSYQGHKYRKSIEQEIIEMIFKGLWWLISLPFRWVFPKRNPGQNQAQENVALDRNFAMAKWQEIEQLMQLGNPSNYSRAVLEADKLLDHLLKGHRAPGLTMGDRLKASENKFSHEAYQAAWEGHKVRNELVHSSQYELTNFMARGAIQNFQKAINELI